MCTKILRRIRGVMKTPVEDHGVRRGAREAYEWTFSLLAGAGSKVT